MGVEYILKNTLLRRSLDNVTVVLIAFTNLKHAALGVSYEAPQLKHMERVKSAGLNHGHQVNRNTQ